MRNFATFLAFLTLVGAGAAQADIGKGRELSERLCSACHSVVPGQASPRSAAPPFASVAAEPSITELSLRAFLRTPHWTMPNIIVQPDDAGDIADYILSLRPKP